ncbi:MAG: hypothetical protein ACHQ2Z_03640 [Elusimicrobiota bacterium]
MKRWVAALVAFLFLATATLHVLAHRGESDSACVTCQAQTASMTAVTPPSLVVVRTFEIVSPRTSVARVLSERVAAAPARAPPALPA